MENEMLTEIREAADGVAHYFSRNSPIDPDDARQEALVAMLEAAPHHDPRLGSMTKYARAAAWRKVGNLVTNTCAVVTCPDSPKGRAAAREMRVRVLVDDLVDVLMDINAAADTAVTEHAAVGELAALRETVRSEFEAALAEFAPRDQKLLRRLRALDGSLVDTAREFRVSKEYVHARWKRLRRRLRSSCILAELAKERGYTDTRTLATMAQKQGGISKRWQARTKEERQAR